MKRLLIANRGEIACRIMRTAADMGIETVAVFSDADSGAPYVAQADQAVALGGNTPAESYLDMDKIVNAAELSGADAIHPGYGFLSERADFAQRVMDAGLTFVGPRPEAIAAMGSKLEAKRIMAGAGVPILRSAELAESLSPGELDELGASIGYPLLIKASAGGGGRGMRIVTEPGALSVAVASARREAQSAFADGTVYAERYVSPSRHVEVQIFGDDHGGLVHLGERECSIQRRHQKIIEEAPCSSIDDETRQALHRAALDAGRAISYTNAGTVEFLVGPDGDFFFLEVNTRLQVEHPVTEMVTGIDLVEWQLRIARGEPIPETAAFCEPHGHAIEARLYAEDPTRDYQPSVGDIHHFEVPSAAGMIRVDSIFPFGNGSATVSRFYDSMIAKVIAWDTSRAAAAQKLAQSLTKATIDGIPTNRSLLVRTLGHPNFLDGSAESDFLTKHRPADLGRSLLSPSDTARYAAAAALAMAIERRRLDALTPGVRSGFRNVVSQRQRTTLTLEGRDLVVEYRLGRQGRYRVAVDGDDMGDVAVSGPVFGFAESEGSTEAVFDLDVGGLRWRHSVRMRGDSIGVDGPFGGLGFGLSQRFNEPDTALIPGSLVAAMPGTVVRVLVSVGDRVSPGDPMVVMEAMKMELVINAPKQGVVASIPVAAGDAVEVDQVVAVIDVDDEADAAD